MEKACASLPSGISVCYNLTWPTVSLMKDGLLGDLRFGLAAGQVEKNRTMGLDLGSCSCLPSPFDLGLPVGHRDGSRWCWPVVAHHCWRVRSGEGTPLHL
ncbi:hypothetical protein ACLOJK_019740 [Asimina triloba]